MAANPLSPDGKWMLTPEGWMCLKSDLSKTPDGQWTYSEGRFVHAQHLADEYIEDSVHLLHEFSAADSLAQSLVSTQDTLIMGDLKVDVTVNQGPSMDEVKQLMVELLAGMGASTWQTPTNISDNQRRLLSESIESYDEIISKGGESDPATELMVATAAKISGDYTDATYRLTELIKHHPRSPEADDAIQVLAQISIRLQDWKGAESYIEQAMARFEQSGNWNGLGNTLMRRARVLEHKGASLQALEMYGEATAIAKRQKLTSLYVRSLANNGILLSALGRFSEAKNVLSTSLQFARAASDLQTISKIKQVLSKIYEEEGDLQNSSRLLRESRADHQDTDDKFILAQREFNEGKILEKRKNLHMARAKYIKAERMFAEIKVNRNQGETCLVLGELDQLDKDYNSAIGWYSRALECFSDPPQPADKLFCLSEIGGCHIELKNNTEAINNCTLAVRLAEELSDHETEFYNLINLGIAQANSGNLDGAKKTFVAAKNLAKAHQELDETKIPHL
jgi:tetratricopeptide (TPR) repeat protein